MPCFAVDLSGLPVNDALAIWHEGVNTIYETRLHQAPEGRLQIRHNTFHFREFLLAALETVPLEFRRSHSRIGRDGIDSDHLHFLEQGQCGFHDREPGRSAHVDDLYVVDNSEPFAASLAAPLLRDLAIFVPRRLLEPFLTRVDGHNARIFPARAPLVSLLRSHLRTLFR